MHFKNESRIFLDRLLFNDLKLCQSYERVEKTSISSMLPMKRSRKKTRSDGSRSLAFATLECASVTGIRLARVIEDTFECFKMLPLHGYTMPYDTKYDGILCICQLLNNPRGVEIAVIFVTQIPAEQWQHRWPNWLAKMSVWATDLIDFNRFMSTF